MIKKELNERLKSISLPKVDYLANKSTVDNMADEITLTDEDPDTQVEGVVDEDYQIDPTSIMKELGILGKTLNNEPLKVKATEAISIMVNTLNSLGFGITLKGSVTEDDDKSGLEDDDLFPKDSDKAEASMDHFGKVMESLAKKNQNVVEIADGINPRIKKGDLVNYLKTK
jgi:hypothetical protein